MTFKCIFESLHFSECLLDDMLHTLLRNFWEHTCGPLRHFKIGLN